MSDSIAIHDLNRRINRMKHNRIAVVGFAASLLVGAGAGLVLNIPGGASATGTITQDQSDAISTALAADHCGPRGEGHGGEGHGGEGRGGEGHGPGDMGGHGEGHGGFGGAKIAATAATALGITADDLKTELDAGKTIADVATEKGVDVQTVIDAIVADQTADIATRVTDFVNGVKPTAPAAPADVPNDTTVTTTG
ncbi:MAG: hypothetical protein ABIR32_02365 [Ilumatobacteraceae bacterium]